ncbi:hypothetical protein [Phyllobacterium sp. OV277]|uniref:hypothetical protein n=1 Tax=Phyllobacterium sp. OV277 TaxID=1882772 RepID=UPI00087F5EB3|nr:hypothetical protein [Phyllobacterium sp. OV277]SDP55771.1 hypothetical protein SAMN05443582_1066 [Phyllobacterium sp. OV277]
MAHEQPSNESLPLLAELAGGYSPIMIWIELNACGKFWPNTYAVMFRTAKQGRMFETLDRYHGVAARLKEFSAERWQQLANGAGWTPISCAALSWCKGSTLDQVLDIWRRIGAESAIEPAADFAALLLNPELLPENKLSTLIALGKDTAGVALLLAARAEGLIVDVPDEKLQHAPQVLQKMIQSRALTTE